MSCLGLVVATVLLASSFAVDPVSASSHYTPTNVRISRTASGATVHFTRNVSVVHQVHIWRSFKSSCSSLSGSDHTSANITSSPYTWADSDAATASVLSVCVVPQLYGGYSTADIGYDATVYYSSVSTMTESDGTATVSWSSGATTYWRVYIWTSSRTGCSDLTGYQRLGSLNISASTKTYTWTDSQVSGTDFMSACIVPRFGSVYYPIHARLVRWQYLCNPTDYPATSLGEALGLTAGESRTVTGTIPATEGARQCKDVARKRSAFFSLEIPADAGGAVRVTAVKGDSAMYPEVLVRRGEDSYSSPGPVFYDTGTTANDADARGSVESGTTYTIQLRARDTTGEAQAGDYTLKVERLLYPSFLRYSYQNGVLHGYWDSKVERGTYRDAGIVLSCGSHYANCRDGVASLYGEYKLNDGAWNNLATASPPDNQNSSTVDLGRSVSGIDAGDDIQFRARYSGTNIPTTDYVESPVQTYFGEVRLPPPYGLTIESKQLEADPITYEIMGQWQGYEFAGADLEWVYYIRLNEQVPFAVSGDGGRAREEVFLWRTFGLLRINVRVSVKCTRSSGTCSDVGYGGTEYDIPAQVTWISTWSQPTLLNVEPPQGAATKGSSPAAAPDAAVIGLVYAVMDGFEYPRSETLATTFSVLLCLGAAIGGAIFILRRMKITMVGVMLATAFFLFIFVGLGMELFGVPPALVVVVVAVPIMGMALTVIRRMAL